MSETSKSGLPGGGMQYTELQDFVQKFRWCPECPRAWDPVSGGTVHSTLADPAAVLRLQVCRRHIVLDLLDPAVR